ncbi:MAG: Phosphoribosylformylglycinamidine synthase 2, partial [Acidobacteriota bacterium]
RNLSCVGAEPIGLTDCLNYGNPEKPENMWTFEQGCLGIRQACLALGVPIVSGNVSLYNDTEGQSIFPTPMIGAVGLIERCYASVPLEEDHPDAFSADVNYYSGSSFRSPADVIYLLGTTRDELGGSEYLKWRIGRVTGPCPELHLDDELALQQCLREGIRMGLMRSAHDLSEGGLLIGCVESAFKGGFGFQLELCRGHLRLDSLLFGESASRAVISVHGEAVEALEQLARNHGVPWAKLGVVGGKSFSVSIDDVKVLDIPCVDLQCLHRGSLERQLDLTS